MAAFADCRAPEEAMARFQSLDQGQRMQLIAMFSQVRDARRNPERLPVQGGLHRCDSRVWMSDFR